MMIMLMLRGPTCALHHASTCAVPTMRIAKAISSGNMTLKVRDGN